MSRLPPIEKCDRCGVSFADVPPRVPYCILATCYGFPGEHWCLACHDEHRAALAQAVSDFWKDLDG